MKKYFLIILVIVLRNCIAQPQVCTLYVTVLDYYTSCDDPMGSGVDVTLNDCENNQYIISTQTNSSGVAIFPEMKTYTCVNIVATYSNCRVGYHNNFTIVCGAPAGENTTVCLGPEGCYHPDLINYRLLQNYPNPFNPSTKISYIISNPSFVKITIYDIMGKEIKTIVNEYKEKGNYTTEFDGSNLSSGIYVYKLETDNFTDVKRMLLIK